MPRDIGDVSTIGEVTADYLVRIVDNPNSDYPVEKLIPGAELTPAAGGVPVADAGGYYTGTTVEAALTEIANGTTLASQYAPIGSTVGQIPAATPVRTGDQTLSAGYAYGSPAYADAPLRVRRARVRVSGQTGRVDVGVYDGTDYTKLTSSGDVQVAPAGPQEIALQPTVVPAGPVGVWVGVSGAAGLASSGTQGDMIGAEMVTSGGSPLPATITGADRTANSVAAVVLGDDPSELSTAYAIEEIGYGVIGQIGSRLYARNLSNDFFAYSDDSGDTWTDSVTTMTSVFGSAACLQIIGYATYMFAVLNDGTLKRANLNAFSTWTDKSVSDAPVGTTGRVSVLASYGGGTPRLFYTNYNADVGTPGVYVWRSGSAGDTWSKTTIAASARHGHAIAIDPTTPTTIWLTIGDSAPDRGLWKSTDNGVTFSQVNTNTRYGIDILFAYSLTGAPSRVIMEGDGNAGAPHMMSHLSALTTGYTDPVIFPDLDPADGLGSWAGSARAGIVTSEGNLVYASTGEAGAIGGREGLWIAKGPWFTTPVLLQEWDQGSQPNWSKTYESGAYLFNTKYKITRPVFAGQ